MIEAVLFDFGGVVLDSPIDGFRAYEATSGIPHGFIQKLNLANPDTNAWACAERGEIDEAEFYRRFAAEARVHGIELDAQRLVSLITGDIRPAMVAAIESLAQRYRVACLTNNMSIGHGTAMANTADRAAAIAGVMTKFHHVIESRKIGARKPERRFFEIACEQIGVAPSACIFLDDLGQNLKPARAMGMQTIKVGDPAVALAELATLLGHAP